MKIEHNSRLEFYRTPFGAVTCKTEITLKLAVSGAGIPSSVKVKWNFDGEEQQDADMSYVFSIGDMSVYSAKLTAPEKTGLIWYHFSIVTDEVEIYYGNNPQNLGGTGQIYTEKVNNAFQITVYDKSYTTPEWFKSAVAYQIFPDRFFNGNEDGSFHGNREDIIKRAWNEQPFYKAEQFGGEYRSNDFFGGNLKGIIKKLPYLSELGISVIYLNPIFKAYSNHKYDTGSYEEIDPMFGDEEIFRELCAKAKEFGIRIILDGVFNHTGSDSMYFNKNGTYDSLGAYQSQQSPYYSWYRFAQWPDNYESWWGMQTLPQVEENSAEYRKYILSGDNAIIKKWLRSGASGWRLEVVDELPDSFVKELRENVKSTDKDAVIIGEVWEDASNKVAYGEKRKYFMGSELDSVMNYPMRSALIDFALGYISAHDFNERLMSLKENYPKPAYYSLLNMVSGHDVERIMTLMCGAPSRHDVDRDFQANYNPDEQTLIKAQKKAAAIMSMQMTLPGVPCVFYGDEIGTLGYGDPFCRAPFAWDKADNNALRDEYIKMISLRNNNSTLAKGEFEEVYTVGSVYGFIRYDDKKKFIIISNMSDKYEKIRLDAARFDVCRMDNVFCSDEAHNSQNGIYFVSLSPWEVKIFECDK